METKITPQGFRDGLALDNSLLKLMERTNPAAAALLRKTFTREERVVLVRNRFQAMLSQRDAG